MKEGLIFLAGGGDKKDSKLLDQKFAEEVNKSSLSSIAYIPIALEPKPYEECLEWFRGIFARQINSIEMWTSLKDKSARDLEKVGAIYLGGGNTVRLLKEVRSSSFDLLLENFVKGGGLVYGGSAGAIILGKDIRTAPEVEGTHLTEFNGLNLLRGFSVVCHYEDYQQDRIASLRKLLGTPVLAIPERGGILLSKDRVDLIGHAPVVIFTDRGIFPYSPGEFVDINTIL